MSVIILLSMVLTKISVNQIEQSANQSYHRNVHNTIALTYSANCVGGERPSWTIDETSGLHFSRAYKYGPAYCRPTRVKND